jgi:hypothetical protein
MPTLRLLSSALLMTGLGSLAFAQSTTPPRAPETIGVEPSDARETMERARRREAEATVVPIDNSAAQRTREDARTNTGRSDSTLGTDRPVVSRAARADRQ